jgi:hypothetical protein
LALDAPEALEVLVLLHRVATHAVLQRFVQRTQAVYPRRVVIYPLQV